MAVRFLIGPAGSGKTHHCLESLRSLERAGRPGVYLVPEQFTYSADRELLEPADLLGLRHVRVLSFTRLAWWLRERAGEAPLVTLDDAVRPMVLRSVLARMDSEVLGPLAGMRGRPGVLLQLARFIGEVRNHGPLDFLDAFAGRTDAPPSGATPPGVFEKLRSLAAVYGAYSARLREMGRRDPEEHLFGLEPLIAADAGLADLTVLVDGFLSWTRRESELLVALALRGVPLEIALCCDLSERRDPRVPFRPVLRSLDLLASRFTRAGIRVEPPRRFPGEHPTRFRDPQLARIERQIYQLILSPDLAENEAPALPPQTGHGVRMREARDRRQEVILWAREIDRWTRLRRQPTERDAIAVLVRDVEPYRDLVREVFERYEIPFFLDERRSVLAHPRVRLILGALDVILSEWRREAVVGLLRNPLLGNPPAVVDLLENLSLEFGRNYERWYDENWAEYQQPSRARFHDSSDPVLPVPSEDQKPDDDEGEEESEAEETDVRRTEDVREQRRILLTEPVRRRVLLPLADFERRWRTQAWTGEQAVVELELLLAMFRTVGRPADDWEERVETALSGLLREMAQIWFDLPVSLDEFARTLREGLLALRLGLTPIKQDQVVIGDVQRSRVHGLQRVIIGGVNDGVFPRAVADDPVLGERDRMALAELGVPLGPTAQERQEEEAYLFYIGLTRASEEVLITWTQLDSLGKETPPSPLLDELVEVIPEIDRSSGISLDPDELPVPEVQTSKELGAKLLAHLARLARKDTEMPAGAAARVSADALGKATTNAPDDAPADAPSASPATSPFEALAEVEAVERALALVIGSADGVDQVRAGAGVGAPSERVIVEVRSEFERGYGALAIEEPGYLPEDLLQVIYPDRVIPNSVSRLQEFAACPFQSFARGILRLRPRPEARVTPLETGTLAHAALELFFGDPSDRAEPAARLAGIFRRLAPRPEYQGFQMDDASRFRWEATRRALDRFLAMELDRLGKSSYRIVAREKSFGMGGPGLELPLPTGKVLLLRGQIDRLDVREDAGRQHALVIDYKRSPRTGLPGTLEAGVDLQLAAYLLFAQEVEKMVPAGGLYVPVVPSPPRSEKLLEVAGNRLGIRAHGLVLADEAARIDPGLDFLVKGRSGQMVASEQKMQELLATARRYLISYATTQARGWIAPRPLLRESRLPCERCEVGTVCRYRKGIDPRRREAGEGMVAVDPIPVGPTSEGAVP